MTAYMTAAEMLARQQRTAAADARASADPSSVTDADLADISPATLSSLMAAGKLTHLGIGARRQPGRRH